VACDPDIIDPRGRRHDLCRYRLLNDNDMGWSGIVVKGEAEVEAEAHAAVPECNGRSTGENSGAE
jgi:hypothetical protein